MSRAMGPGGQVRNNLIIGDNRGPNKVYETTQKYEEYVNYLGNKQDRQDIHSKLIQWKTRKYEQVELLVDPAKVSPLLKVIVDENTELRLECQKLGTDLSLTAGMVERLIGDNLAIQKHLQLKQLEMQHFMESKQVNSNEELLDCKQQIQSLQEENNLLIRHLEEMRRNNNEDTITNLHVELDNGRELFEQQEYNFQMCREREADLTRELMQLQPQLQDAKDYIVELETKLALNDEQVSTLKNQLMLLTNKHDIVGKQQQDRLTSKIIEMEEWQTKSSALIRENGQLKQQLDQCDMKIIELVRENTKLQQECTNYQMLGDDLYAKGRDLKTQLEMERIKKPIQRENKVITEPLDVQRLQYLLEQAQNEYLKLDDFMSKQIEQQKKQSEQILDNMKTRYNVSLQEKTEQINQLERQLDNSLTEIDLLRKDLNIKQSELEDIRVKSGDYLGIKKIVDAQQMEIRMAKNQLQDKKILISELLDEKDKMNKLVKLDQAQHYNSMKQIEQNNMELKQQLGGLPLIQSELDRISSLYNELDKKYIDKEQEYYDLRQVNQQLQVAKQQLQLDLGVALTQVENVREQLQYFKNIQNRKDQFDQVLQENQILRQQLNLKQ